MARVAPEELATTRSAVIVDIRHLDEREMTGWIPGSIWHPQEEDLEAWAQLPFMRQMNGHVYWEASPAAHSDAATSIQAHVRRKGTKRRHSQPPKPSSFDA